MADDDRGKWYQLQRKFNQRAIARRLRKVEGATIRHTHKFIIKRWVNVRESQRHIIMWVLAMGMLIAATGLQLMWYQQSYKTTTTATDGTYAEAAIGPVDTLNPLFADTSAEHSVDYLMFSRLLNYDTTGHLNHDLVTSIQINDTKTIYTVKIRPDVKWHDGVKLTTSDIAFTINLIKNPDTHATVIGWDNIAVRVIDQTTIEFKLLSPYAAFEHYLTFPVIPEHILGGVTPGNVRENNFSSNPVGSGPFKFLFSQDVDVKTGRKVIYMARNDEYYRGITKLSQFQLHVYDTNDSIVRALSSNEVNAATGLSSIDVGRIDTKRYSVSSQPIQSGVYALLNTKSDLLKNIALRSALRLATNTEAIRKELPSTVRSLDLPFVDGQLTGDVPKAPVYDQAGAARALDAAGWLLNSSGVRTKAGQELKLSVVTTKDGDFEHVLEILVGQWRAVGITVETNIVDPKDVLQNFVQNILQPRNYDVLLYQLNIGADPDVFAYWHSSQISSQGFNFSNYSNAISDDALLSARSRIEPALRNAKYITFAKQWLSDVPAIGLYQPVTQYVYSDNVHPFNPSDVFISPIDRYSDVLDWSVGTKSVYKTP